MSVWKRGGKANRGGVYCITYTDRRHGQTIKRIVSSGVTDKTVAKEIEKKLKRLVDLRLGGEPTPTELVGWAASASATLQNHLARFELIEHDLLQGRTRSSVLMEEYLAHCIKEGQDPGAVTTKRTQLTKLIKTANDCGPRLLKAEHLQRVVDQVKEEGRSHRTANQHRMNAIAFATWLRDKKKVLRENPFKAVEPLPEDQDRRRVRRAATPEEIARLVEMAPEKRARIYLALLLTGLRRGELRQMIWADADFEAETIRVRAEVSKNGKEAELPMHPELKAILLAVRPKRFGPEHRWFHSIPAVKTLNKDLARAGVAKVDARGRALDLHALRGTLATRLALQNVPMTVVQKLLRHADIKTTAKFYTHEEMDDLRQGVKQLPLPNVTAA